MKKRIFILVCFTCCLMVACSVNDKSSEEGVLQVYETSTDNDFIENKETATDIIVDSKTYTFSFNRHKDIYMDNTLPEVRLENFKNITKNPIKQKEEAIEAAKNEVDVKYNRVNVFYDKETEVWMVYFYHEDVEGGDQYVYLNKDGLTKLIVYGE